MTMAVDAAGQRSLLQKIPPAVKWGLIALIQLGLISVPLIDRLQVQTSGTVVPLALVPVDPRDLLRGDYVIINLEIARISPDLPGGSGIESGDEVFVSLKTNGKAAASPEAISRTRDKAGALAIRGRVDYVNSEEIRVNYGIDAFFLPEGEGLIVEKLDLDRVLLDVAIAQDGRSLPMTLLVDGKAFKSDTRF